MSRNSKGNASHADAGSSNRFSHLPGWQRACIGLAAALGLVIALVATLESILRWVDYGYPTTFFLEDAASGTVVENERFVWQFYNTQSSHKPHPLRFSAKKDPDKLRLFVLGESAALGTPEPAFSFSRILDRMLHHRYPEKQFEVINLAMRGINSHMIRVIAQESVAYDPDLVLVYMGNNELVGWQAPGPDGKPVPAMQWIRIQQALRSSKLSQWIRSNVAAYRDKDEGIQDMDFFRRHRLHPADVRRDQVLNRFKQNLNDMVSNYADADIPVLLGTVIANEKDFPPLGSLHQESWEVTRNAKFDQLLVHAEHAHRKGDLQEAMDHLTHALQLDGHYAELHYRMGRLALEMEEFESAKRHLRAARDMDALPFRAPAAVNAVVSEVAGSYASSGNVTLINIDQLARAGFDGAEAIPGQEWFYEHVHFRFRGDYFLASYFFPYVQQALQLPVEDAAVESDQLLSLVEVAKQLAYNPVSEGFLIQSMLAMQEEAPYLDQWMHAPSIQEQKQRFQAKYGSMGKPHLIGAIGWTREAMKSFPQDWNLPFMAGRLAARLEAYDQAMELTIQARDLMPHATLIRMALAQYMTQAGQTASARSEWEHILKLNPQHGAAREALGKLR